MDTLTEEQRAAAVEDAVGLAVPEASRRLRDAGVSSTDIMMVMVVIRRDVGGAGTYIAAAREGCPKCLVEIAADHLEAATDLGFHAMEMEGHDGPHW